MPPTRPPVDTKRLSAWACGPDAFERHLREAKMGRRAARRSPAGYVLCCCERLRDGREEWAKWFGTIVEAVEYASKIREGGPLGGNTEFRLFAIGDEIPLREEATEIPQPAKRTVKIVEG